MKSSAIKENKVFRRLYHRGKSKAGASLVTYCMKNRRGETRVGITTSKKIGTAVERNRARRVIRAAFSQLEDGVTGWDLVFVARSRTTRVKMQVVLADMEKQFTAPAAIPLLAASMHWRPLRSTACGRGAGWRFCVFCAAILSLRAGMTRCPQRRTSPALPALQLNLTRTMHEQYFISCHFFFRGHGPF